MGRKDAESRRETSLGVEMKPEDIRPDVILNKAERSEGSF